MPPGLGRSGEHPEPGRDDEGKGVDAEQESYVRPVPPPGNGMEISGA